MNTGTLKLYYVGSPAENYDYGISLVNSPTINTWQSSNVFPGLTAGIYFWALRLTGTTTIVKTGSSEICNNVIGSAGIELTDAVNNDIVTYSSDTSTTPVALLNVNFLDEDGNPADNLVSWERVNNGSIRLKMEPEFSFTGFVTITKNQ